MSLITPITDRTLFDAAAVRNGDLSNTKGYLGYTDLNRINENLFTLYTNILYFDFMSENWVSPNAYKTSLTVAIEGLRPFVTDWTVSSYVTAEELEELNQRIQTLRNIYTVKPTTPQAPNKVNGFSYIELNAMEQIIKDIYDVFIGTWNSAKRLGNNSYCGETGDFIW